MNSIREEVEVRKKRGGEWEEDDVKRRFMAKNGNREGWLEVKKS